MKEARNGRDAPCSQTGDGEGLLKPAYRLFSIPTHKNPADFSKENGKLILKLKCKCGGPGITRRLEKHAARLRGRYRNQTAWYWHRHRLKEQKRVHNDALTRIPSMDFLFSFQKCAYLFVIKWSLHPTRGRSSSPWGQESPAPLAEPQATDVRQKGQGDSTERSFLQIGLEKLDSHV